MRKIRKILPLLCLLMLYFLTLGCQLPFADWLSSFNKTPQDPLLAALEKMQDVSTIPLEVSFEQGFPISVIGAFPITTGDRVTQAMNFLSTYSDLYHLDDSNYELKLLRIEDTGTADHVVFYQTYQNIPVYSAQIVISLDENTVIRSVGNLLFDITLDTETKLTALQASSIARQTLEMADEIKVIGQPTLTIFDMHLLDNSQPQDVRLAWHISFGNSLGTVAFIDANNGELIYSYDTTHTFDYDLSDAHGHSAMHDCYAFTLQDKDIGDEYGIFKDEYKNDQEALDNWQYGHDAYHYYALRFNRSGYNGNDYELEIHINAEIPFNGAYYEICHSIDIADGVSSYYITAHEYTHGVIDFTSDFKYNNQPGALSEFFAYIMGSLAEYQVVGYAGEFQRLATHSRDHMSKYWDTSEDNGGVHENAWIPGRAAYLITAGGEHNGFNIIGLGPTKAEDLFYATMISLSSHASFETMANAAVANAVSWAGNGSWTDQDVCQVRNAFVSVGILRYGDSDCDGQSDIYENDADNDFIFNTFDNCPQVANPTQADNDGDGEGDACDPDDDNDSIRDSQDNCQWIANPSQDNADGDRYGDACEDTDYDNIIDSLDNCQVVPNPDQIDTNADGEGDACDNDDDGDGLLDDLDPCPLIWQDIYNRSVDTDGDGIGNACDNCQHVPNPDQINTDGIGWGDACDYDDDEDGIEDIYDNCPLVPNPGQVDLDFDGIGMVCDEDEEPLLYQIEFGGTFQASPGDYFNLSIPLCDDFGQTPNLRANLVVDGLPDQVAVWMTNQYGEMVAKPGNQTGSRAIGFANLGDDDYMLVFSTSPYLEDPLDVDFSIQSNCGLDEDQDMEQIQEEIEEESDTAQPTQPQPTEAAIPPTDVPPTASPTETYTPEPLPDGWITGQVWKDQNANSVNDKGDQTYSGVTVKLGIGACSSTGAGSVITDAGGFFQFDNLQPGTYCVTVDIQETCGTNSIPTTPIMRTVTVPPGASVDAGLFGFAPYIC